MRRRELRGSDSARSHGGVGRAERHYHPPRQSASGAAAGPRHEFFYFTDNGDLTAVRYDDWKLSFKTIKGNLFTGTEESTNVPWVTNLRQDPWERYQTDSMMYARWWGDKLWTLIPASAVVGQFLQTFKEFPPSQVSGTFGVEQALKAIEAGTQGGGS